MTTQRLYNGVRFPMPLPSPDNVARLDHFARPYVLACMEEGLQIDPAHFERMAVMLTQDMDAITEEVKRLTGYYVNLDSGDQVSDLLFKKLGLKQARPKFTSTGARESVENEVLVAIQHDHEVVPKILNYKEYSKLRGTYVKPIPKLARTGPDGKPRLYPKLKDTRVPSGRLACEEPNLLAMPNRTERGRQLCDGFICEDGWLYVSIDESQIEPRVVAHRSKDTNLCNIYHNEEDIYSDFAISAFKLPDQRYRDAEGWHYPGVHKKMHRFPSKTCILASIYDVTNTGLLEQMPTVCKHCLKEATLHDCRKFEPLWNESNCQDILNAFYLRYPGILDMRRRDHQRAKRYGYIWDEFGRLLHVTAVKSVLEWVVSAALRETGNLPIQGTAQGTIKLVMAQVEDDRHQMGLTEVVKPQLQIHDELLYVCREDVAVDWAEHVKMRFEQCIELEVPVKAGAAMAATWGSVPK